MVEASEWLSSFKAARANNKVHTQAAVSKYTAFIMLKSLIVGLLHGSLVVVMAFFFIPVGHEWLSCRWYR